MEEEDEIQPEQISDSFVCAVCLELIHKPIILACGHISCFWCVHHSMSFRRESHCPVCRHAYQHFPAISKMLHFLLCKIYPITYKKRENQILEMEKQQMDFSPDLGSSAAIDENGGQVSVDDVLCSACNQMLYRPVALNCGHLYCQGCIVTPSTEKLRCQVCECPHPGDFPKVCLVLEQFLEEQFSLEYAQRKRSAQLKQIQDQKGSQTMWASKEGLDSTESSKKGSLPSFPTDENFFQWLAENGSNFHDGVGCDSCGMVPIIGDRYKCKDCKEKIGFDLCGDCYNTRSKLPGRFNQQHTPEHRLQKIQKHLSFPMLRAYLPFVPSPPFQASPITPENDLSSNDIEEGTVFPDSQTEGQTDDQIGDQFPL